jgi:signal transduction histidine kinase
MAMSPSIIPLDEDARLAAVHRYEILDTPREGTFDRITALAARVFDVPIAMVGIVGDDRVWFKSRHGLDVEQYGRDAGLCASAILGHAPLVLVDASADSNAAANPLVAGEPQLRFYAGVPLTSPDGHNVGTFCVCDTRAREFSEEDVVTLVQLAEIIGHALDLRLVTRRIETAERERRTVETARRGLEAAEHERTRWARELHDETLQNLGALHMLLMSGLTDPDALAAMVGDAANLVQDEIANLRHLIAELRPAVLDHAGLQAALESLGRKLRVMDGLEVELKLEMAQFRERLGATAESMLYRAVQEALANVAKHAAARRVEVAVRARADAIEAIIADDGIGFDAAMGSNGFGLVGMRERAMLMGGELQLQTAPGAGTTVRFIMPLGAGPSSAAGQSTSP